MKTIGFRDTQHFQTHTHTHFVQIFVLRVLPNVAQASRWTWRPPRVAMSGPTWWARRSHHDLVDPLMSGARKLRGMVHPVHQISRDTLKVLYIAEGQCVNLLKNGFSISKSFFNQKMWILNFDEHMCVPKSRDSIFFHPFLNPSFQVSIHFPPRSLDFIQANAALVTVAWWFRRHVVIDIDETTNLWIFMDIYGWYHIIYSFFYNFDRLYPMVNHAFSKVNRRTRCSIFHCKLSNDQRGTVFIIVFFFFPVFEALNTTILNWSFAENLMSFRFKNTSHLGWNAPRLPRRSRDKCGRRAGPVGRFTEHLQLISCDLCEREQSLFSLVLNIL